MYSKGELVWAKLKGFPWWPAIVSKLSDNKPKKDAKPPLPPPLEVTVNFLGENSHATLPEAKIAKFEKNLQDFSTDVKKKKLIDAIDLAKRLHEQNNPPGNSAKQSAEKNSKLKRKPLSKESEIEKTDSEDPDDPNKLEDEISKKLKTENMPSYERVTRSKAVSTKKEDVIERPNEIKEEGLIIDHSIRVIENREMSIEKPKEEPPKLSQEKKTIVTRLTENKNVCPPEKQNVSSSLSISLANEKKAENLTTSKKKIPPNPSHKKKSDDNHPSNSKSKFVKRALVSSKIKQSKEIMKKTVSDTLEENELIKNLENRLKYGIEIVVNEDNYDKNFPEIVKTVNDCVNDIEQLFLNSNANVLSIFLSKNIGKEMALLEKLCEENKGSLKRLCNIDYYIKELKKANSKIESEVFAQFFDCFSLLNELNIPYTKNIENTSFFANTLIFASKSKYDPYHTPLRNSNPLNFSKGQSSFEENGPHQSENSSNNAMNNEDLDLKNLGKIEKLRERNFSKESDCNCDNNKTHVENKILRKKICLKMSQILMEKYNMEKTKSQDITLRVECKIRGLHPNMKEEYKEKIRILLKLMKECKMDVERYLDGEEINFDSLKMTMIESTPQNKYDEDNVSNDRFDTPLTHKLSEFNIKSQ